MDILIAMTLGFVTFGAIYLEKSLKEIQQDLDWIKSHIRDLEHKNNDF